MITGPKPPRRPPEGETTPPQGAPTRTQRAARALWRALAPGPRRSGKTAWAIGLLCLLALVLAVVHAGSLERCLALARAARPGWLLVALAAQSATYLCAALVWRQPLLDSGYPLPMRVLVRLGIVKIFTDQALPTAGLGGSVMAIRGLLRRGVPRPVALMALVSSLISRDIAFLVVVFASAWMLWLHHHAGAALFTGVAVFLLVLLLVPAALIALRRWNREPHVARLGKYLHLSRLIESFNDIPLDRLLGGRLLVRTVGLQLAIFLFDAGTLWLALIALGAPTPLWTAFASFAVASMVATIGPVPVGLGTFEAASVGMLRLLGVPIEAALAATLLLRGLTFWLPMLPGVWLAHMELRAGRSKAAAAPGADNAAAPPREDGRKGPVPRA